MGAPPGDNEQGSPSDSTTCWAARSPTFASGLTGPYEEAQEHSATAENQLTAKQRADRLRSNIEDLRFDPSCPNRKSPRAVRVAGAQWPTATSGGQDCKPAPTRPDGACVRLERSTCSWAYHSGALDPEAP